MTLDEAERLARDLSEDDTGDTNEREWELARALLAVLPVCRAAIAVADDETNNSSPYAREYHRKVLREALDQMRAALRGSP